MAAHRVEEVCSASDTYMALLDSSVLVLAHSCLSGSFLLAIFQGWGSEKRLSFIINSPLMHPSIHSSA